MTGELAIRVNAAFWQKFKASFSSDQLESMERLYSGNGSETYWLLYYGMAYIAEICNDKIFVNRARG